MSLYLSETSELAAVALFRAYKVLEESKYLFWVHSLVKELRSYQVAFESGRIAQISDLIARLEQLNRGGYRVYISELQDCLLGGLLLAAASVSYALLELFVRDLMAISLSR
jgi:hypothetical protein